MTQLETPGTVRRLAKAVSGNAPFPGTPADPVPQVRQGIVQQAYNATNATINVLLSGATTPVDLPVEGYPPGVGEVVWIRQIGDTQIVFGSTLRAGWRGPWGAPWGEIVSGAKTTTSTVGTSIGDVMTGTQIATFTLPSNRILRIDFHCGAVVQNTAGGNIKTFLADGSGTQLGMYLNNILVAAGRCTVDASLRYISSTSTSVALGILKTDTALQLKVVSNTSANTADFFATATAEQGPMWFKVVDEGPYSGP